MLGVEGVVEITESSCFCINCGGGQGECTNNHLVLPWLRKKLLGNVHVNMTNHWNDVYISDEDEQEEKREKITPGKHDVLKAANEKQQHPSDQHQSKETDEKITPGKRDV